ncbi:MAG: 2-C-methyl-D-erythritol 4-phosphate cytidylyltransferase, partial [Candidatus Omnitrophica bacterium]|nr:2-C-methyl-D-erythritol 4-phosphate cytidylyltransferase [Candidatus Omnitrophota bacterium]
VLIHDAARPFVNKKTVNALIKEAQRFGAAITGVPVKDTVKEAVSYQHSAISRNIVKKTLRRENLWAIQTPQVFKKDLILRAYKKFGHLDVTDDAMLVEKLGVKVSIVLGAYKNIKITTAEDLRVATCLADN